MTVANKVQSKVPQLRFPEFSGEWDKTSIGAHVELTSGNAFKSDFFCDENKAGARKLITPQNFTNTGSAEFSLRTTKYTTEECNDKFICGESDLLILLTDLTPTCELLGRPILLSSIDSQVLLNQRIVKVTLKSNSELKRPYLHALMQTKEYLRYIRVRAAGTTVRHSSNDTVKKYEFRVSGDYFETEKIAEFLSSIDKKISLLKQKHEQLVEYKKGIMQQLFSQQLRFKDDNGQDFPDWKISKFKQHFERVTQKNKFNNLNVLTISGQRGLINQQKYFNKSVSAQDVTGYYLMNKGEFAYNKSYSKGYPMGAIKRLNNYEQGVVSTLYICFKSKNGDDRFWEQYFEAGLLNREIQKIAQEGARNHGLLNVSVKEFFDDMNMHSPSEDEQAKIADFLESVDKKINLAQQQIEQTQTYKQGLLQQMFV